MVHLHAVCILNRISINKTPTKKNILKEKKIGIEYLWFIIYKDVSSI